MGYLLRCHHDRPHTKFLTVPGGRQNRRRDGSRQLATACCGRGRHRPAAFTTGTHPPVPLQEPGQPFDHRLLVRRSLRDTEERAYYVVFAPADVGLAEVAGVAGLRWTIETCFATAKDEPGLDHCEARSWHGWHRHMTLVMARLPFSPNCAST